MIALFHLAFHLLIESHLMEGPGGGVEQSKAAKEVEYLRLRRSLKVFKLLMQGIHFSLRQRIDI